MQAGGQRGGAQNRWLGSAGPDGDQGYSARGELSERATEQSLCTRHGPEASAEGSVRMAACDSTATVPETMSGAAMP